MPGYSYVAVDSRGKEKRGRMDAENREEVVQQLKNDGLIPVSIKEQGMLNKEIDFSIGKKVKPRDLSVFCRQFVSITQAGVPMKEALQMLTEQTENKYLKQAVANVLTNVEKGNTLADSMAAEKDIFPDIMVHMVEAGESSGSLDISFAVMLLFVIPIFIDMFADLDVEMPALTMGVMNLSKWTASHWYVILAVIVAVIAAYQAIYRTDQGRLKIDLIKMKMPLLGKLSVKSTCAQFARTMSTLMAAGVPTINCLETVAKIVKNIHYKNALMKAREEVMKGIPLSEPLEASGVFPPMVYHMTSIGEDTGNMEEMLTKLADYYDEEVEITTQSVLAAMEPLIIVFMALIVGTLVIAVIMPIGTMYEGLDNL